MKKLLVLLVLVSCAVEAEIYKSQDEKGEWVYSDRPSPSAQRMKLPPLSTYTPTEQAQPPQPDQPAVAAGIYKSMVFVEPLNDLVIRDQTGEVAVSLKLDPPLKRRQGHEIQCYIDDEPHGEAVASAKFTLKNLDRGTHVLGAVVFDAGGKALFSADPVTIHVKRVSALNAVNLNNPDNPKSLRNPDNIANNPNNPYNIKNNPNAPGPINPNLPRSKPPDSR